MNNVNDFNVSTLVYTSPKNSVDTFRGEFPGPFTCVYTVYTVYTKNTHTYEKKAEKGDGEKGEGRKKKNCY